MAGQRWPCASAPVLKRIQTEALQGRKIIAQGKSAQRMPPWVQRPKIISFSHRMGEGGRRPDEGWR